MKHRWEMMSDGGGRTEQVPVREWRRLYRLIEPLRASGLDESAWSELLALAAANLLHCEVGVFAGESVRDAMEGRLGNDMAGHQRENAGRLAGSLTDMVGRDDLNHGGLLQGLPSSLAGHSRLDLGSLISASLTDNLGRREDRACWAVDTIRRDLHRLPKAQATAAAQAADYLERHGRDVLTWLSFSPVQFWLCATDAGTVYVADCIVPRRQIRRCVTLHPVDKRGEPSLMRRLLLRVMAVEILHLYQQNLLDPYGHVVERLSPRERQTMSLLMTGASEKQVAAALGLSTHTVHTYVKSLHRQFDVTSRSELLSRFISPCAPALTEQLQG